MVAAGARASAVSSAWAAAVEEPETTRPVCEACSMVLCPTETEVLFRARPVLA